MATPMYEVSKFTEIVEDGDVIDHDITIILESVTQKQATEFLLTTGDLAFLYRVDVLVWNKLREKWVPEREDPMPGEFWLEKHVAGYQIR